MKQILIVASAAAFAFAGPALAKPGKGQGHGQGHGQTQAYGHDNPGKGSLYGYGRGGCPPGLAKKNNGCMPPGKAKQMYSEGQRYPGNYGSLWNYNQIPYDLRSRYDLDRSNRYYYGDGYLYQVDPRTRLIEQVVSAIVR